MRNRIRKESIKEIKHSFPNPTGPKPSTQAIQPRWPATLSSPQPNPAQPVRPRSPQPPAQVPLSPRSSPAPHPARTRPGLLRVRSPRRPLPHRASGPPASLSRTPAPASLPSRCLAGPTSQGRPLPRATIAPGTPKFPAGFPSRARTPRYPAPSFKSPRGPPRNPSHPASAAAPNPNNRPAIASARSHLCAAAFPHSISSQPTRATAEAPPCAPEST